MESINRSRIGLMSKKRGLEMVKVLRAMFLSLMLLSLLAGCGGGEEAEDAEQTGAAEQATSEHPTEHPTEDATEHPTEHPASDHPDSATAKSDHPKSDHPK